MGVEHGPGVKAPDERDEDGEDTKVHTPPGDDKAQERMRVWVAAGRAEMGRSSAPGGTGLRRSREGSHSWVMTVSQELTMSPMPAMWRA